jgi:alanyl-tRNA synthetase
MDLKSLRSIYVSLIDKIDKEILLTYSTIGKETSFVIGVNRKNKDYNLATPLNKLRSKYTIKGGGGPQMIQAVIDKDKFEPLINELIKGAK